MQRVSLSLALVVLLGSVLATSFGVGETAAASATAPLAVCTFASPEVTSYPANGAAAVPQNARILLRHFVYVALEPNVRVTVAGSAIAGTFVPIGEQDGLAPGWTAFDPAANLPAGAEVTLVVGTGAGLVAEQTTTFQVGSTTDATAPSGGEILAVETFVGGSAGGEDVYGWSVALNEANDAGGPAWIRLEIVTNPTGGSQTTDTRVVEGSTYGIDGGTTSCSTGLGNDSVVTITAQAFDLAGNLGTSFSRTFEVGPAEEDEGLCSVARVGGSGGTQAVGTAAGLFLLAILLRRRGSRCPNGL